jgi:hypothetical protein
LHTDCLVGESRGSCFSLHAQPSSKELHQHVAYLLRKVPVQKKYDDIFDNCIYILNEIKKNRIDWNIDITNIYEIISRIQLKTKIVREFSNILTNTTEIDPLVKLFHVAHQFCYSYALLILHRQASRDLKMSQVVRSNQSLNVVYWHSSATNQACSVVISYVVGGDSGSGSSSSSSGSSSGSGSVNERNFKIRHNPHVTDRHCTLNTIHDTTKLNIQTIIDDAKRSQASTFLSKAWESVIETLPWFLTPSDVRLTWCHGHSKQITSMVVSINGGSIDFILQIDMLTGRYRCSIVGGKNIGETNDHAPLKLLIASCPLHEIEQEMNAAGGDGNPFRNGSNVGSDSSKSSANSNNKSNNRLGTTLASIITRVQCCVVNSELAYAADQANLLTISSKLIVQDDHHGISLHASHSAASIWNSENTTIFACEGESKLYCICVGAGTPSDPSVRFRYIWPPICEVIYTKLPIVHSNVKLGPFRSLIQLQRGTETVKRYTGKRKRGDVSSGATTRMTFNTVGTKEAVSMLQFIYQKES